jgi:hypothetical protein
MTCFSTDQNDLTKANKTLHGDFERERRLLCRSRSSPCRPGDLDLESLRRLKRLLYSTCSLASPLLDPYSRLPDASLSCPGGLSSSWPPSAPSPFPRSPLTCALSALPSFECSLIPVFSFSFVLRHISFFTHRGQSTTFTSACFTAPASSYANGSSSVARRISPSVPVLGACSPQRVLPQVVSPAPESTSDSVRQRRANYDFGDNLSVAGQEDRIWIE